MSKFEEKTEQGFFASGVGGVMLIMDLVEKC